jgi:hypothetical protein
MQVKEFTKPIPRWKLWRLKLAILAVLPFFIIYMIWKTARARHRRLLWAERTLPS